MNYNEFLRLIKSECKSRNLVLTIEEGANHKKLKLSNGKRTTFPRHGTQEVGEGLRQDILKQLGLK